MGSQLLCFIYFIRAIGLMIESFFSNTKLVFTELSLVTSGTARTYTVYCKGYLATPQLLSLALQ